MTTSTEAPDPLLRSITKAALVSSRRTHKNCRCFSLHASNSPHKKTRPELQYATGTTRRSPRNFSPEQTPMRSRVYLRDCRRDDIGQHRRRVARVAQVERAVVLSLRVGEERRARGGAPVRGAVVRAFFHGRKGRREPDSLSVHGLSRSAKGGKV